MKIIDADIITGYNIMGFDFKYIYERCEELGIH
jgi:DNA polymerase elongation subunit (family B)